MEIESSRTIVSKGFRVRVAEALSCQKAYVSNILNGDANFSLEQGYALSEFLNLDETETRYFLALIEYERAGTKALKTYFKKQIDEMRSANLSLKENVLPAKELDFKDQSVYYSSWIYAAVHMMVTVPELRTVDKMALAVGVEQKIILDALKFLESVGLAKEEKSKFLPGISQMHLGTNSPFLKQHHTNWRNAAIQNISTIWENDLHYSTLSSLSREDAETIKSRMVEFIKEYTHTVAPSEEETIYNFNLDFYPIGKLR